MDDCEALCDRLTIVVDGEMKCIGKIQDLKNRHGQSFAVLVKLLGCEITDLIEIKTDIERQFAPYIVLKEEDKVSSSDR